MTRVFWNRIRLNFRALRLAVAGKWLRDDDVAASYNTVAETYDARWLVHLHATTDRLHDMLADLLPDTERILELGCGSGYSTDRLRRDYPGASILAVDIAPGMIAKAKERLGDSRCPVDFRRDFRCDFRCDFHCGDMLELLKRQRSDAFDLVFSGWAIGYSNPATIITESARTLKPGGTLAVVVNRLDTMPAVFGAFRKTMRRFPGSLEKAVWPRFPKDVGEIATLLTKYRFNIQRLDAGVAPIAAPPANRLDWLLGTGVLAGFDSVLPLRDPGPVRDWFADELDRTNDGWEHHYILFIVQKKA